MLETFNAVGALSIAMLAVAFLLRGRDVLRRGLGAVLLAYGALLYLSRAAAEFIWLSRNPTIAATCGAVGLLHVVLLFHVRPAEQA